MKLFVLDGIFTIDRRVTHSLAVITVTRRLRMRVCGVVAVVVVMSTAVRVMSIILKVYNSAMIIGQAIT